MMNNTAAAGLWSAAPAARPAEASGSRLLFVVNDARFFVSHRLPLALAARAVGYDVHLAAHPDEAVEVVRAHGLPFHPLTIDRNGVNPANDLRTVLQLALLVRRLAPRILHGVTIKPVLYGGAVARLLRVPGFVGAVSGLGQMFDERGADELRLVRRLIRLMYRRALAHGNGKVIFQNNEDRAELVGSGLVGSERAVLIPGSGVDPDLYPAAPEPSGDPVVVLPSRLLWAKGVAEFVAAAKELRAAGVAARFALVGEPPAHHRDAVPVDLLRRWQAEGVVEWWGFRADMPAVYARSHVVCLPSFYREGVPKALIEAAACERPIVTTDTPGCRDICRDGVNGLCVPPRDVPALAAALGALLTDPDRRRSLGAAGRRLVLNEFTLAGVIERTLAVYRSLEEAHVPAALRRSRAIAG